MSQIWLGSVAFVGSGEFTSGEMQLQFFCECTMLNILSEGSAKPIALIFMEQQEKGNYGCSVYL